MYGNPLYDSFLNKSGEFNVTLLLSVTKRLWQLRSVVAFVAETLDGKPPMDSYFACQG